MYRKRGLGGGEQMCFEVASRTWFFFCFNVYDHSDVLLRSIGYARTMSGEREAIQFDPFSLGCSLYVALLLRRLRYAYIDPHNCLRDCASSSGDPLKTTCRLGFSFCTSEPPVGGKETLSAHL